MIEIICWNIQWGKGADGVIDLQRTVDTVMQMGSPDVLCFQEVSRNFPAQGDGVDQVAELRGLLPDFALSFGVGADLAGEGIGHRRQFGNVVLSRLAVAQVFSRLLPRPATPGTPHLQRQCLEVIVATQSGPLRIMNTHLEYFSSVHRAAQVDYLRGLHRENFAHPPSDLQTVHDDATAPPQGPCPTLLCGDFNMESTEASYARLLEPFADGTPALVDAWAVAHPGQAHPVTCGVYERIYWSTPHCRDYMLATADLGERIRGMEVDRRTDASDHQPLRLLLDL